MNVRRLWPVMVLAILITGCDSTVDEPAVESAAWRSFENADGTVTRIPEKPARILSTSVTVTGTLLAIEAPVVASAAAADHRFFSQWQPVAEARGVRKLWAAGSLDLESVLEVSPDLIVVSTGGADSALMHRADLASVAPTIVVDYGAQSWQELASELGRATGRESQARQLITAFDEFVREAGERMELPEGRANIISYNGPGITNPVATREGAHGRLLRALGFRIEQPVSAAAGAESSDQDFVRTPYEYLTRLEAPITFLTRVDDSGVDDFLNDPVLANLPSVQSGQVYGLGKHSFRIDYFSSREIVDGMLERFSR